MNSLKLLKFRIENFRSIVDSGWIEAGEITTLIGTNESGKTNALLALWKLNPAKDGKIDPLADYPRSRFTEIRNLPNERKPIFITTQFEISDNLIDKIQKLSGGEREDLKIVEVSRKYNEKYVVSFPNANPLREVLNIDVINILDETYTSIDNISTTKAEEGLKASMLVALETAKDECKGQTLDEDDLKKIKSIVDSVDLTQVAKRSLIVPRFSQLIDDIDSFILKISKPHPTNVSEARQLILNNLPSFVYYSQYGNLDSEIYLPHVVENMRRNDLGSREQAKVRTLKVLFDFVQLKPEEILNLGKEIKFDSNPTSEQVETESQNKKEREILLQSASAELTRKFRTWWKQGEHRIRFQADGNHFRIWVSDDKRPEEVELEGRSAGLQWFLSFYLIFLVEQQDAHQGAILLLDEPGPLAQEDLSAFFESLSQSNQVIYTTHSPFLVDSNHLDRVKSVYIDDEGTTRISANLRASEKNPTQSSSVYAVHAALGLTISSTLLIGCQAVIVEGPSDQHYFSAIKNFLVGRGLIQPKRELVFIPAGGIKAISPLAALVSFRENQLPPVVLDGDESGHNMASKLKIGLYKDLPDRIVNIDKYTKVERAEVEDLFPTDWLANIISRLPYMRGKEDEFSEIVNGDEPIVGQVERFVRENGLDVPQGWKVDIATITKEKLLSKRATIPDKDDVVEKWKALFEAIILND